MSAEVRGSGLCAWDHTVPGNEEAWGHLSVRLCPTLQGKLNDPFVRTPPCLLLNACSQTQFSFLA